MNTSGLLLSPILFVLLSASVRAEFSDIENPPVAVRFWGQGMVSIETWWNLTAVIDPYEERTGYDTLGYELMDDERPKPSAELVLLTQKHADYKTGDAPDSPVVLKGPDPNGKVHELWGVLDRPANSEIPTWRRGSPSESLPSNLSPHAIKVTTIPALSDGSAASENAAMAILVVDVAGVRIVHFGEDWPSRLSEAQLKSLGKVDILCVPRVLELQKKTINNQQATRMIKRIHPRFILHLDYPQEADRPSVPKATEFLAEFSEVLIRDGNTFAISASDSNQEQPIRNLILMPKPDPPSEELAGLLKQMDQSCRNAQKVFEPLSARQMNWRPPNGTHTPRWNTEHMMGRQLGFFSQIFAEIDRSRFEQVDADWSMLNHIDLNPKQMPADYTPAHPDWDGAEEARQMQRANAYVQRFAYLLHGIDLDKQAPGSRWTLRGLLEQMDRHFTEHTANVQKKFELEGWPEK